jgi:hypothetical protein
MMLYSYMWLVIIESHKYKSYKGVMPAINKLEVPLRPNVNEITFNVRLRRAPGCIEVAYIKNGKRLVRSTVGNGYTMKLKWGMLPG